MTTVCLLRDCVKKSPLNYNPAGSKINFEKHIENQRVFQETGIVKHSKQTEIFVSLLQYADSKRYNLPVTQHMTKIGEINYNRVLKQGDIRSMFAKPATALTQETNLISQSYNILKEKDVTQSFPAELFDELAAFSTINSQKKNCRTCELLFECPKFVVREEEKIDLTSWVQPDLSILDGITLKNLQTFTDSLTPKSKEKYEEMEIGDSFYVPFEEMPSECDKKDKSVMSYETPRNFDKILKSFRICKDEVQTVEEKSFKYEAPKNFSKILNLMNSFEESKNTQIAKSENLEVVLKFFKLATIQDLFIHEETTNLGKVMEKSPETKTVATCDQSPDLFGSSEEKTIVEERSSPIICSYEMVRKIKAKKKLFDQSLNESVSMKPKLANLKTPKKSFFESSRLRLSTSSRENLDIDDICDKSSFFQNKESGKTEKKKDDLDIDDICDTSYFFQNEDKTEKEKEVLEIDDICDKSSFFQSKEEKTVKKHLDIDDICDLQIFGLTNFKSADSPKSKKVDYKNAKETENDSKRQNITIDDLCDISDFFGESLPNKTTTVKKRKLLELEDFSDISFSAKKQKTEPNTQSKPTTQLKIKSKDQNNQLKELEIFDDFVDLSFFTDSKKNETRAETLGESSGSATPENLNDYFDASFATSPQKVDTNKIPDKKTQNSKNTTIIDLTDSDLEASPILSRNTQLANKTQLSITQMLSQIRKTNDKNSQSSQKENETPKSKKRKHNLSLSTKNHLKVKNKSPKPTQKRETPKSKKIINISLTSNSDDEFEETSPIFAKPKVSKLKKNTQKASTSTKATKKQKRLSEFIENEAEVSIDESVNISEDEDSGEDCYEASFVADETQDLLNTTTMHAKYLQSVKSPVRGKFKIPQTFQHDISNVFSQPVSNEGNTYMNDSFCVGSENEEEEEHSPQNDYTELEMLERKLKEMKRNKKRKKEEDKSTKRRRIIVLECDSD